MDKCMKYLQALKTNVNNFDEKAYNDFVTAELIVANEINRTNKRIIAIRNNKEEGNPDLSILDRVSEKLLGYVEVQGMRNFKSWFDYKYVDFQLAERRIKTYDKTTVF